MQNQEFSKNVYLENNRSVFFYVLLTVNLSIFILVIKKLDAQNFCFTIRQYNRGMK